VYKSDVDSTALIMEMFGLPSGRQPTLTTVQKELGPTSPADDVYLRKFIIFLMSSVFAPTTGTRISPRCYPSVINTRTIKNLNWAKFIIDIIIQTANEKGKNSWAKACMSYLLVRFFFHLHEHPCSVYHILLLIIFWTQ
jgi:hypothetical protein